MTDELNDLTDEVLAELERLHEEATPDEWFADMDTPGPGAAVAHSNSIKTLAWPHKEIVAKAEVNPTHTRMKGWNADFRLIVAMRNHLPALIAAARRCRELEKDRDHWKAAHDEMAARNKLLRNRPDLPLERVTGYDEIMQQLAAERAKVAVLLEANRYLERELENERREETK